MKIKVDPNSRFGRLALGLAGRLLRLLILAIGGTCRLEIVAGADVLARLRAEKQPVILSFWHNRIVLAVHFLYRRLHQAGLPLTLLTSQSRDGELVTQVVKSWGIEAVRGSATRGGLQGLRAVHRAITRQNLSPVMVPDGPTGPLYHFKVGVAVLAQTTGAPILPIGFAARSTWTLRSWDRLQVPRPFTRLAVAIGEPRTLPPRLADDALERERATLEETLNQLTRRAEAAVVPAAAN